MIVWIRDFVVDAKMIFFSLFCPKSPCKSKKKKGVDCNYTAFAHQYELWQSFFKQKEIIFLEVSFNMKFCNFI